jgi:hypothetical protein
MFSEFIDRLLKFDISLYLKLKDKLYQGNYILQSSYIPKLRTRGIYIDNYLMFKEFIFPIDYNWEWFNKYARKEYLLYEYLINTFSFDEKIKFKSYDIYFFDVDKEIYIKEIAKDLYVLTIDNYSSLVSTKEIPEFELYFKREAGKYIEYEFDLLDDYTIDEIQSITKASFGKAITFLKSMLKKEVKRKQEEIKVKRHKVFINIKQFDLTKFNNSLIFNEDFYITEKERVSNCYYLLLGGVGSGKSYLLNHMLFNVLKTCKFDYVFYFDTQKLFNEYQNKVKYDIDKPIYIIREQKFNMSFKEIIFLASYFLEKFHIMNKRAFTQIDLREINSLDELREELNDYIEKIENTKDWKEVRDLEILKSLQNLLNNVRESEVSLMDFLRNNEGAYIIQFDKVVLYEAFCLYLKDFLYEHLYTRNKPETWLFFDETQKYMSSETIEEQIEVLLEEKRQFGLRVVATGLKFTDVALFRRFTNIILNDLSDTYVKNLVVHLFNENIDIRKPKEKIIVDNGFTRAKIFEFKPFLF